MGLMDWVNGQSFLGKGATGENITNGDLVGNILLPGLYTQYMIGRNTLEGESKKAAGPMPTASGPGPQTQQIDDEMMRYLEMLQQEMDLTSPAGQAYLQRAVSGANLDAKNRGIGGGLSGANTQNSLSGAMINYRAQALDRLGQGLNMYSGRNLQNQGLQMGRDDRYQQLMAAWNERAAGPYKIVGAGLGAAAGGYFGGPEGAAAGAKIGGSMGGVAAPYQGGNPYRGVY